jgi:AraC-like DNA-binding protein
MYANGPFSSVEAPRPTRSTNAADYQDVPRAVAVMPKAYAAGMVLDRHFHPRAQLLYATAGLMMASAEDGTWVVPEGHALWIPPRLPHAVATHGAVAMCSAYLDPAAVTGFPTGCRVIAVSSLLAAALTLDEIGRAPATPLALPLPRDPRLRRVCLGLIEDPASEADLDAWADRAGASRRTLTRGFRAETGLSFGDWRARARVIRALALAADGRSPQAVAAAVGYRSAQALRLTVARVLDQPGRTQTDPGPVSPVI